MTSAQLKAFYAVAKYGSFTAAAQRLSLSQPAISDHVKKLEEAYGTELFVRVAKGVKLTQIGSKLFAIAERHTEAEAEALTLLSQAQNLEEGEMTIGADAAVHIMSHLKLFRKNHPKIKVKLQSGNSLDLVAKLKDFSIDFAVAAIAPEEDTVAAIRIGSDRMVAIVNHASPLAKRKSISLKELSRQTLVLRETGSATRKITVSAFQARGLVLENIIEAEGRETTQEIVAQGLGIALVSKGELNFDQRVVAINLADCDDKMSEWLLYLKSRGDLRLVQAFLMTVPQRDLPR